MTSVSLQPPALPVAREVETASDREQYSNVLRLFFNRLVYVINNRLERARWGVTQSTSTAYTTTGADENTLVVITHADPIAVELYLAAPEGFRVSFMQGGAGAITLAAEAGGTAVTSGSLTSTAQYGILEAFKVTATQWVVK